MKRPPPPLPPPEKKTPQYETVRLYDNQKHDGGGATRYKHTGTAALVNTTDWVVVDFDVKDGAPPDFFEQFQNALDKEKDIVVVTPNGGFHVYLKDDTNWSWGRCVKIYKTPDFDVDIFFSSPKDTRSLIVVPPSKVTTKKGSTKAYTYHPNFKTQFPKDYVFSPHTKASKFFEQFPFLVESKRKVTTPTPSPRLMLPKRLSGGKKDSSSQSSRKSRVSLSKETDFKVQIAKCDLTEKTLGFFANFGDIEIHADWNQGFEQEITLYHYFGVLNWLQQRSTTPLEDTVRQVLRFTQKATDQYDSRKKRYATHTLSPQVFLKCLHSIKKNAERDLYAKMAFTALLGVFPCEENFTKFEIDLEESFDFSDFMTALQSSTSFSHALSLLSKVWRFVRRKNSYIVKRYNRHTRKNEYTVENYKSFISDTKAMMYRTEWGRFRLSTIIESAAPILFCEEFSLFKHEEDCLCCFEGWAYEPQPYDCAGVKAFLRLVYEGLCKLDPTKFEFVIKWYANIVQNPGAKNGSIILLSGPQGCGKTTFVNVLCKVLGDYAVENIEDVKHLTQKFNKSIVSRKVLVVVNEMSTVCERDVGILKSLCTEHTGIMEEKYEKKTKSENHLNILITTNDVANFEFDDDERRFFMIEAGNYPAAHGESSHTRFFSSLYESFDDNFYKAFLNVMLNVDLKGFNPQIIPEMHAKTNVGRTLDHFDRFLGKVRETCAFEKECFYGDELYKMYCSVFKEDEKPPEKNTFFKSPEITALFEKKRERRGGLRPYFYRLKNRRVSLKDEPPPEEEKVPPEECEFFQSLFAQQTTQKRPSLDDGR